MNFDLAQLDDGDLASALADQAGQHLLALRAERFASHGVQDDEMLKTLGDDADRTANDLIVTTLKKLRPNDAILSEESTDDLARLDAERVWIVDPLDGTREYKTAGRTDWAVHIALWERARHDVDRSADRSGPFGSLTLGVVGLPALGMVLRSDQVSIAQTATNSPLRIIRSASRSQPVAEGVAQILKAELVSMGSAGAKAMAVVRGEADAYIHTGGQWEWDSAAPVQVALGHGLFVVRVDGSPIRYNQRDPYLPDLVMCRPDLADQVMTAVRKVAGSL